MLTNDQQILLRTFLTRTGDHDAAIVGVKNHIAAGGTLRFANTQGETIPMLAIKQGNAELIELLIDKSDCDWLAQSANRKTALMYAAAAQMVTSKLVWRCRSGLDQTDYAGQDALYIAALHADAGAITCLLNAGANPALKTRKAPLLSAPFQPLTSPQRAFEIVEILINAGAKATAGHNPISLIAAGGCARHPDAVRIVNLLLSAGATIDGHDARSKGATPLIAACANSHQGFAERLLEEFGADPNLVDQDGNNALIAAAAGTFPAAFIRKLTEKTADINACNARGDTALKQALLSQNIDTAFELIACGADPDHTPIGGAKSAQEWLSIVGDLDLLPIIEAATLERHARSIKTPTSPRAAEDNDSLLKHAI